MLLPSRSVCDTFWLSFSLVINEYTCRGGEIGRRTALRGQREKSHRSSSLLLGTIRLCSYELGRDVSQRKQIPRRSPVRRRAF